MRSNAQKPPRAHFESEVLPHLPALYGSAFRLTRHSGDAEDLVQDCLLRAYRFWGGFEEGSNCKAWLFKILTNTFINSYQKKRRGGEILRAAVAEQEATDGILVQKRSQTQKNPEQRMLDETFSEEVALALENVPKDFRVAVVLCDVEGFSYKEIAEMLDCPVGTVMSRLYRGRRLLREQLRDFATSKGLRSRENDEANKKPIQLDEYRKRSQKP